MSDKQKILKYTGVKGMNDILPADASLWELFENTVQSVLKSYGYGQIRTPILEYTDVFVRGIGEVTDIVEKEMYSFTDPLNGDQLSLRPEATAGVVRAVVEHNLTYEGPKRVWYAGPMFRHERPQRGRYRQFHQVGAEAFGFGGPDIDAELIMLSQRIWDDLGLSDVRLEINSIGNLDERQRHRAALISYFEQHEAVLDADARRRLHSNPLRILDTKNPAMQELVDAAPKLLDYLGEESTAHLSGLRRILDHNNVPYKINPRLVRGMDYYNRTVFEWVTDQLGSQGTICGGGRYDPLMAMYGAKTPLAVGFAIGVERVLELMKLNGENYQRNECDVYVVHQGEAAGLQAFVIAERLRTAGLDVVLHCAPASAGSSFKSQMKKADASGAAFAVILGEDEISAGTAVVKSLRGSGDEAQQNTIAFDAVIDHVVDEIVGHPDHGHDHGHTHFHS